MLKLANGTIRTASCHRAIHLLVLWVVCLAVNGHSDNVLKTGQIICKKGEIHFITDPQRVIINTSRDLGGYKTTNRRL